MRNWEGKVCVVTGAQKSIGFGVAQRYCELGAKVALLDINPAVMESAENLRQAGYDATGWVVNITDKASVDQVFDQIRQQLGPVDALANVAGVVSQHPIEEVTLHSGCFAGHESPEGWQNHQFLLQERQNRLRTDGSLFFG